MAAPLSLRIGDAFRGIDALNHIWFIVTHPTPDGEVIITNFTRHAPDKATCSEDCVVVDQNDHRYLTKTSCIFYRDIRRTTVQQIVKGIAGEFRREEPLSPALLRRVRQGALDSDLVPRAVKDAIRASLGQSAP